MACGLLANLTLAQVNAQVGQIALNAVQALNQGAELQTFVAGGTGVLTAAPISMASGDATTMVNAIYDLYVLNQIMNGNGWVAANGTITLATGTGLNFMTNINNLVGTGVH